jgi:hypothetical protein
MNGLVFEDLVGLVAFPGDEDIIAFPGFGQRLEDGLLPVRDDPVVFSLLA